MTILYHFLISCIFFSFFTEAIAFFHANRIKKSLLLHSIKETTQFYFSSLKFFGEKYGSPGQTRTLALHYMYHISTVVHTRILLVLLMKTRDVLVKQNICLWNIDAPNSNNDHISKNISVIDFDARGM